MAATANLGFFNSGSSQPETPSQAQSQEHHANTTSNGELAGSLCMRAGSVAHFVTFREPDHDDSDPSAVSSVGRKMLFVAERIWRLKRPKVVISVTGGADDFHMSREDKDKLMQGLMRVGTQMDAWFITGGTNAGIMKYVGEARKKYASHVPLIGIASWRVIKGRECMQNSSPEDKGVLPTNYALALLRHRAKQKVEGRVRRIRALMREVQSQEAAAEIDPNHSHLFFIDGGEGTEGQFGREIASRAEFEAQASNSLPAASSAPPSRPADTSLNISNPPHLSVYEDAAGEQLSMLPDTNGPSRSGKPRPAAGGAAEGSPLLAARGTDGAGDDGDQELWATLRRVRNLERWTLSRSREHPRDLHAPALPAHAREPRAALPLVLVCVQGGPGTARTVLEATKKRTPVFLVRGSGKAADLISDLVLHWERQHQRPSVGAAPKRTHKEARLAALLLLLDQRLQATPSTPSQTTPRPAATMRALAPTAEAQGQGGLAEAPSTGRTPSDPHTSVRRVGSNGEGEEGTAVRWLRNMFATSWRGLYGESQVLRVDVQLDLRRRRTKLSKANSLSWMSPRHGEETSSSPLPRSSGEDGPVEAEEVLTAMLCVLEAYFGQKAALHTRTAEAFFDALEASRAQVGLGDAGEEPRALCSVFDLNNKGDMSSSLLQALVNGLGNDKTLDQSTRLARRLKLAVEWNDVQVLAQIVRSSQLALRSSDSAVAGHTRAMNEAFHLALAKLNRPDIVDYLITKGATVEDYKPPQENGSKEDQTRQDKWTQLIQLLPYKEPSVTDKAFDDDERKKFVFHTNQFQEFVKRLVNKAFLYKMGGVSPEFDLMVWSALMNQRAMATVFWKEYCFPIRAALSVCKLYRQLAKKSDSPPSDKRKMLNSALFFEQVAVEVQNFSRAESPLLSLANLECPMRFWSGQTILDVAVLSQCEDFVAECCREAMDRRFAGDLLPYSQNFPLVPPALHHTTGQGLKALVLFNVLCLGLLAPFTIKYNDFPRASNLRYPTQRMDVPEEHASHLDLYGGEEALKRAETTQEREKVWTAAGQRPGMWEVVMGDGARLGWLEGVRLFWQAPVTLFVTDAIMQVLVLVIFTWFVVAAPDTNEREPFSLSYYSSPKLDPAMESDSAVFPFEQFMACYFATKIVAEGVQFTVNPSEYLDVWNLCDQASIAFFFAGFALRFYCATSADRCDGLLWEGSVPINALWVYFYSICLFLLWTRLMRVFSVSKHLGPLVILVIKMGKDILQFALIWGLLILGFSVLLRGSTGPNYLEACRLNEEGEGTLVAANCWRGWWVVRTIIQGIGNEPLLEEMSTDASIVGITLLWIVMNLLLLNLLIAIMSNTYSEVQAASERKFLMDLYNIVIEFSRRSVVAPFPANIVLLLLDLFGFVLYRKRINTVWGGQAWNRQLDLHLRRNRPIHELLRRKQQSEALPFKDPLKDPEPGAEGGGGDGERVTAALDHELEASWEAKMFASMERARASFVESAGWKELLAKWDVRLWDSDAEASKALPSDLLSMFPDGPSVFEHKPLVQAAGGAGYRQRHAGAIGLPILPRRHSLEL